MIYIIVAAVWIVGGIAWLRFTNAGGWLMMVSDPINFGKWAKFMPLFYLLLWPVLPISHIAYWIKTKIFG